jgi:hypothetical protein
MNNPESIIEKNLQTTFARLQRQEIGKYHLHGNTIHVTMGSIYIVSIAVS